MILILKNIAVILLLSSYGYNGLWEVEAEPRYPVTIKYIKMPDLCEEESRPLPPAPLPVAIPVAPPMLAPVIPVPMPRPMPMQMPIPMPMRMPMPMPIPMRMPMPMQMPIPLMPNSFPMNAPPPNYREPMPAMPPMRIPAMPMPLMPSLAMPAPMPSFNSYPPFQQAFIGMVPPIPGLVNRDGGVNILPFTDIYADWLEKYKVSKLKKKLKNLLESINEGQNI